MPEQLLLVKRDHEDKFKLIHEDCPIVGSFQKITHYISNNEELLDMVADDNSGNYLRNGWRHATAEELNTCLNQAKKNLAFSYLD